MTCANIALAKCSPLFSVCGFVLIWFFFPSGLGRTGISLNWTGLVSHGSRVHSMGCVWWPLPAMLKADDPACMGGGQQAGSFWVLRSPDR